jgi:hypothetical protein
LHPLQIVEVLSANSGLDTVFFGHSLVTVSVIRKIKALVVIYTSYYSQIMDTLLTKSIVLAVFDNRQIGIAQNNQCDEKIKFVPQDDSKLFVLLQNNWELDELRCDVLAFAVPIIFLVPADHITLW